MKGKKKRYNRKTACWFFCFEGIIWNTKNGIYEWKDFNAAYRVWMVGCK